MPVFSMHSPARRIRGLPKESAAIANGCRAACLILVLKALVTKATPDLEVPFFLHAAAATAYASCVVGKVEASLLHRLSAPGQVLATGLRGRARAQSME